MGGSSFGTVDDGSSRAEGGGGPFCFSKKRAVKSTKVNMAEGPSTTATLSNQFIVKCSVRGHHVYKRIWSPSIGEPFETFCKEENEHNKYAMAVHLNTVVEHIPREIACTCHFFIENKWEITGEAEDDSSLWRSRSTMPADVLPPRYQGVGKSYKTCS